MIVALERKVKAQRVGFRLRFTIPPRADTEEILRTQ